MARGIPSMATTLKQMTEDTILPSILGKFWGVPSSAPNTPKEGEWVREGGRKWRKSCHEQTISPTHHQGSVVEVGGSNIFGIYLELVPHQKWPIRGDLNEDGLDHLPSPFHPQMVVRFCLYLWVMKVYYDSQTHCGSEPERWPRKMGINLQQISTNKLPPAIKLHRYRLVGHKLNHLIPCPLHLGPISINILSYRSPVLWHLAGRIPQAREEE